MSIQRPTPIIVIIGGPQSGKSTLLSALCKGKKASYIGHDLDFRHLDPNCDIIAIDEFMCRPNAIEKLKMLSTAIVIRFIPKGKGEKIQIKRPDIAIVMQDDGSKIYQKTLSDMRESLHRYTIIDCSRTKPTF